MSGACEDSHSSKSSQLTSSNSSAASSQNVLNVGFLMPEVSNRKRPTNESETEDEYGGDQRNDGDRTGNGMKRRRTDLETRNRASDYTFHLLAYDGRDVEEDYEFTEPSPVPAPQHSGLTQYISNLGCSSQVERPQQSHAGVNYMIRPPSSSQRSINSVSQSRFEDSTGRLVADGVVLEAPMPLASSTPCQVYDEGSDESPSPTQRLYDVDEVPVVDHCSSANSEEEDEVFEVSLSLAHTQSPPTVGSQNPPVLEKFLSQRPDLDFCYTQRPPSLEPCFTQRALSMEESSDSEVDVEELPTQAETNQGSSNSATVNMPESDD